MSITITERLPATEPPTWRVRVRPGRHRAPYYFTVKGSRADAVAAAARWQRQIGIRPLEPNATLGQWLRHWLAGAHDLAPNTIAVYRAHIELWIDPAKVDRWSLGRMRLRDITADDAGAFIVHATDRLRVSARTMRDSVVLIRGALARAVDAGMLATNPWQTVRLPRAKRRPPATPGAADFARLKDCRLPRVRLLLVLAAYTGARRSELLALTWENIDLKAGTMTIGASLEHPRGQPVPTLKEPKTASGRRTIALPDAALSELRLARLDANSAAVLAGGRVEARPVFADPDGSWWTPDAASQAGLRALRELGLPGSLHTLRHAHATVLLGAQGGVSPHVVSRRLGHASIGTTLGLYAHAIPADDGSAADAIDRILTPGSNATHRSHQ
jgi:integrase